MTNGLNKKTKVKTILFWTAFFIVFFMSIYCLYCTILQPTVVAIIGFISCFLLLGVMPNYRYYKASAEAYKGYYDWLEDHVRTEYRKLEEEAKKAIEKTQGYNAYLPEEIAILSTGQANLSAKTVQTLIEFSRTIGKEDTIFLIRVDHEEGRWFMRISGKAIHVMQAVGVMAMARNKVVEIAGNDNLVITDSIIID